MRGKLIFSVFMLLLALGLRAEGKQGCTIACESDPTVTCSSAVGDCSFYYGAYDYLVCDGSWTRCPL
jgi:hypothetical protein